MNKNIQLNEKYHVYIPLNIGNLNTLLILLYATFVFSIIVYSFICLMVFLPKERNLQNELIDAMDIRSGGYDESVPIDQSSSRKTLIRETMSLEDNTQSCTNGFTVDQYNNIIRCPLKIEPLANMTVSSWNIQDQNLDVGPIYVDGSLLSRTYPDQFFGFIRDDTPRVFDPVEYQQGNGECLHTSPRPFYKGSETNETISIRPVGQHLKCIQPAYVGTGVFFIGHPGDTFNVEMTLNMGNLAFNYIENTKVNDNGFSSIFPGQDDPDTIIDNNFVSTNAIYSLVAVCTIYNGSNPVLGSLDCQSAPIFHSEYTIGTLPELFNGGDSRNSYMEPKTIKTMFSIDKSLPFTEPVGVRCHPVLVYDVPDLTVPRWSNDPGDGRNTQFEESSSIKCGVCRNSYNYFDEETGVSEQGDFPQNWDTTCPMGGGYFHKKTRGHANSVCSTTDSLCSLNKFYSNFYKTCDDDYDWSTSNPDDALNVDNDDDNPCTSSLQPCMVKWMESYYLRGVLWFDAGDKTDDDDLSLGGDSNTVTNDDDGLGGNDDDDTPASNKIGGNNLGVLSTSSANCNANSQDGCVCAFTLDTSIGCPDGFLIGAPSCQTYIPTGDNKCKPFGGECPSGYTGCSAQIEHGSDSCFNIKTIDNIDFAQGGFPDDDDDDIPVSQQDFLYSDTFGLFDTRCMTPETSRCCRLVNNANLYISSSEFVVRLVYTESAYSSVTFSDSLELFPGQSCYDSEILNSSDDTPTWCGVNDRFSLLKDCDNIETLPLPNDILLKCITGTCPPKFDERATATEFGVRYTGKCSSNY